MTDDKTIRRRELSSSDRAVSGLLYGILAGLLMAAVLMGADLVLGHGWRQAVNLFNPFGQEAPLQGLLLHLGVSAVYGTVFGLLQPLIPRRLPGWVAGLGYGLLLFYLAQYVLLPRAHVGMADLPASALLLGHIVYGLVLGLGS